MEIFKKYDKVALAEDINYRGIITVISPGLSKGDSTLYTVQWEKDGTYHYLPEALISAKEADDRAAKLCGKKSLVDKFKDMVKGNSNDI